MAGDWTEGRTRTYAPIVRFPWMFPFQPGIAGYREVTGGGARPVCLVTGEQTRRDANTGAEKAE